MQQISNEQNKILKKGRLPTVLKNELPIKSQNEQQNLEIFISLSFK
jgi:hypothetical protein